VLSLWKQATANSADSEQLKHLGNSRKLLKSNIGIRQFPDRHTPSLLPLACAVCLHCKCVHLSIRPSLQPKSLQPIIQTAYKEEPALNNIHMDRIMHFTHTYLITSLAPMIFVPVGIDKIHSALLNVALSVSLLLKLQTVA
jgi:hypothetical protein